MDPATALIIGFVAQTLFIAGLFWQVNTRMDRLATKEDVANFFEPHQRAVRRDQRAVRRDQRAD